MLFSLCKKCSSLMLLEVHRNTLFTECSSIVATSEDLILLILSNFPSLIHCSLSNICIAIGDIINSCAKLKYLIYSKDNCNGNLWTSVPVQNCNLLQLCIKSKANLPDTFMDLVSVHGGLTYVVLSIRSITIDGIATLIRNSSKLLICRVYADYITSVTQDTSLNLRELRTILKNKFSTRKLFLYGSFYLSRSQLDRDNLLIDTDLGPLWSFEYLIY